MKYGLPKISCKPNPYNVINVVRQQRRVWFGNIQRAFGVYM